MSYPKRYLDEVSVIAKSISIDQIEKMISILLKVRADNGRLFILGVGGSAGNAGHAVNDFRKLTHIETYAPTDNVSELTARTNDEGWPTVFEEWLKISKLSSKDAILVFSVGGGDEEKNISVNLVRAVNLAKDRKAKIMGIIGRDGGHVGKFADAWIHIPTQHSDTITPHAESWQGVIWHMLVSDPRIREISNKWESYEKNTP